MDLGEGAVEVEPVERLGDRHHVGGAAVQRDLLCRTVQRLRPVDLRPHLRDRLDGDDARAGRAEKPGQLPRAGTEIHNRPPRAEARALRHPRDGLRRVGRARALVQVRRVREAGRRDGMDAPQLGVTRYASNTASMLRSAVSRVRSDFTSPTSAVYQFFAS